MKPRTRLNVTTRFAWLKIVATVSGILCAVFLEQSASSAQTSENRAKPTLNIMLDFPFAWLDAQGDLRGFQLELAKVIEEYSAVHFSLKMAPVARSQRKLEKGQMDMAFFMTSKSDENLPFVSLAVLGCVRTILVTAKQSGIDSVDKLAGKRIAFTPGDWFEVHYASSETDFVPVKVTGRSAKLRMLARGRIDAFFTDSLTFSAFAVTSAPGEYVPPEAVAAVGKVIPLAELRYIIGMLRDSQYIDLVEPLRAGIKRALAAGRINEIFESYGVMDSAQCSTP